jgi:hypothetical protein
MSRGQGAPRGAPSAARGAHPARGTTFNAVSRGHANASGLFSVPSASHIDLGHGENVASLSTAPVDLGHGTVAAASTDLLVGAAGSASSSTAEERATINEDWTVQHVQKHPHATSADSLVAEGPATTADLAKINEDSPQFFASIVALPVDLGRKSR